MGKPMAERLRAMSGETLRNEARKSDKALGAEIDRLQIADEQFRVVLLHNIAVDEEVERRRKGGHNG